ncbi:2,3,4,5-tetrahydropyridine-2,6-carboxylate N-succinyltransferase [Legionella moravica]|uniref:2,3,4,5-tetrahydropyridine-2,6-carboxylate N-succinyltransferase n=1 Tax=Legionella moravica TaxID=39962 RepID=A0A378JV96_9GAMM|nr:DapH/DapD/GlmU-related protein [Legionella moravica]KTD35341.1 2,3,4,5-tetrahydropyridine-2,6-carboxylate N-succinyltransferase [Legionella moravica]STX61947.1 2,3,4,5-tetrahydropyridine-2,6-carboxylate N-succinyltransferase [Legionella moravica]
MTEKTNRKKSTKKNQVTVSSLLFIDLISFFLSLMPAVVAMSMTGLFVYHGYSKTWLVLPLAPLILFFTLIAIVFLIRISLPKLKPGRYKRELNRMMIAWFCHFALSRAAKITGLIFIIQSFNILKFLYWRALGAKVSFQIMNSYDIDLVDTPLISIGKNVTIGSGVSISCHSDVGSLVFMSPVVIEDDVFIGMATTIGPGTTIKKGAWIGYGNTLVNETVEANAKLGSIRAVSE